MLTFAPHLPWPAWSALVVVGAALLAWYAATSRGNLPRRRWQAVVGLMAVALVLPLVVLLNPIWVEPVPPPPGKPLITLLIDASGGMTTEDVGGRSRFESAKALAAAAAKRLEKEYDIETRLFAETVRNVAPDQLASAVADGETTDLAAAIEEALVADRPQGQTLVLFSDGIHNADVSSARVVEAARRAKAAAAPIFARTFGGDAQVRDVEVRFASPQELAFVGQQVPVEVQLSARGLAGRTVEVQLRRDDKTLDKRSMPLVDGLNKMRFRVGDDRVGLVRYEAVVEPLAGEVSQLNNAAPLLVRTVDEPIRVLLLEGKPYWDTKFLTRTLTTDAAVELTTVVQMTAGRLLERTLSLEREADPSLTRRATTSSSPVMVARSVSEGANDVAHKEEWQVVADPTTWLRDDARIDKFQVIVLGRDADVFLAGEAADRLRRWIDRQGGALVCFRGAPTVQTNRELAAVLPLRWTPSRETRFHLHVTDYGRDWQWFPTSEQDEATFTTMPTLAAAAVPDRLKPAARVLATTVAAAANEDGQAVVTYQPFGLGQIVVVEGAGMWRWAFLPPEHQRRDDVYSGLWRALIRRLVSGAGLMPGQNVALRSERVLFGDREPAAAVLLVRDPAAMGKLPEVELTGPSLAAPQRVRPTSVNDDPTLFRAQFGKLPEGRYQARLVGAGFDAGRDAVETAFDVRRNLTERLDLKARPDLMARLAAESDGGVIAGDSVDELGRQLAEHRERTRPREVRRIEAWDRWWIMTVMLALWAATWGLRRRSGRV